MGIRRSYDRLICTTGFPILVRRHLYIGSGPRVPPQYTNGLYRYRNFHDKDRTVTRHIFILQPLLNPWMNSVQKKYLIKVILCRALFKMHENTVHVIYIAVAFSKILKIDAQYLQYLTLKCLLWVHFMTNVLHLLPFKHNNISCYIGSLYYLMDGVGRGMHKVIQHMLITYQQNWPDSLDVI